MTKLVHELLPYTAEVEWLESDGGQWISTGVVPQPDMSYEFEFSIPYFGNYGLAGTEYYGGFTLHPGVGTATNSGIFMYIGDHGVKVTAADSQYLNVFLNIQAKHKDGIYLDRIRISQWDTMNEKITTSTAMLLFGDMGRTNVFSRSASGTKIKKFSAWHSDESFAIDLIPVRVCDIGYMYDKVSGQLFGNAGTGSFVIGPDIRGSNS